MLSLKPLKETILSQKPDPSWTTQESVVETLGRISVRVEQDLADFKKRADFVFADEWNLHRHTQNIVDLFRSWHNEKAPSLSVICIFAMEHFGIESEEMKSCVLTASVLGEVENKVPYHSNMHYRNVTFLLINLIVHHNKIYAGTPDALTKEQIGVLLVAACIHDLGHDGRGNTDGEGVHHPSRVENRSFKLARSYLRKAGCCDKGNLEDIRVLLICTDASPLMDPNNPVSQMKAAYCHHYQGGEKPVLKDDIAALNDRKDLALMALLLHEADIATSAGLHYNVTKFETQLYRDEVGPDKARPTHVIEFLDRICQKQMLSEAGKKIFAENFEAIYVRTKEAVEEGNIPYKRPEKSDFLRNV